MKDYLSSSTNGLKLNQKWQWMVSFRNHYHAFHGFKSGVVPKNWFSIAFIDKNSEHGFDTFKDHLSF